MYFPISKKPKYLGPYLVRFKHYDEWAKTEKIVYQVCNQIDDEIEGDVKYGFAIPSDFVYWTPTHWAEVPKLTPNEPPSIIDCKD